MPSRKWNTGSGSSSLRARGTPVSVSGKGLITVCPTYFRHFHSQSGGRRHYRTDGGKLADRRLRRDKTLSIPPHEPTTDGRWRTQLRHSTGRHVPVGTVDLGTSTQMIPTGHHPCCRAESGAYHRRRRARGGEVGFFPVHFTVAQNGPWVTQSQERANWTGNRWICAPGRPIGV